jgi:TonB family protein
MGYQALLFCPDEKLARVVTQVFGDLDFSVDPVHEPFAAVKKLMAQRYDAVVVDCENEQNASLLFKSARNSTSNQSSLAIALVEGQAGVAKAYRIGANLVLTKPINVEQAKGTLRVARGLLRKNSDAAGTPTVVAPTGESSVAPKATPVASSQPQGRVSPSAPLTSAPQESSKLPPLSFISQPASVLPAASASVEDEEILAPFFAPSAHSDSPIENEPRLDAEEFLSSTPEKIAPPTQKELIHEVAKTAPVATIETPAVIAPSVAVPAIASSAHVASGSAAAPAPAKETLAPEKHSTVAQPHPTKIGHETPSATASQSASENSSAPSFGILNEDPSGGSSDRKKFLIAAAILVFALVGYFAYGYFGSGKTSSSATPVGTSQNVAQPAPVSAPPASPSLNSAQPASPVTQARNPTATIAAPGEKPATASGGTGVLRIAANAEPETKKSAAAAMLVKSGAVTTRTQSPSSDESAAPPAIDTTASSSNSNLTSLLASSSDIPKPSLATIKISQGVSQGLLIKRVQPTYPQAALAVHAQGAVQIEATVTKDGNVTNLKVLRGDAVLARAALDAVRQWRYKPYYLDGQPVEIQTQITVNFKAN